MVALNYEQKHIHVNKFSRPGFKLLKVAATVIHYTANNGGTADNHFSYFDTLTDRYASAHIFVDKNKALEIIPLDEVAFHANERKEGPLIPSLKATAPYYGGGNANLISIGIEMCMEKDGMIHPDTITRTILVVQMLQQKFGKQPIYRHYDVTGKNCPAPFVSDKSKWEKFLADVEKKEENQVAEEQKLTPAQEAVRQEAIRLKITDGKDPFRAVNQFYGWALAIPQAQKIEALEKRIVELEKNK
ncbi:endolysin [Psychrobacillus phage Spoks]|nr:endolysin [Psychrobacillus phage Spoks]